MMVSVLPPYSAWNKKSPYIWIFERQLEKFKSSDITYLVTDDYLIKPSKRGVKGLDRKYKKAIKKELPKSIFKMLELAEVNFQVWLYLRDKRNQYFEEKLEEILKEIQVENNLEAILTWGDFPSLTSVASNLSIPLIHNELGPLRPPVFRRTAYFDFRGILHDTEISSRYQNFCTEKEQYNVKNFLSPKEIQKMLCVDDDLTESTESTEERYDIGIALQAETLDDTPISSKGFDNFKLLKFVKKNNSQKTILSRLHPAGSLIYDKSIMENLDESKTSSEFIKKVKKIITLDSNLAAEAVLYEKKVVFLEKHPFDIFNDEIYLSETQREYLLKMNFMFLCYLIPYEMLFDIHYYRWRLKTVSEVEIYKFNYNFYKKTQSKKGFVQKFFSILFK